jgi:predicted dehydrogenase
LVDKTLEGRDKADSFELQMKNFVGAIAGITTPINRAQQPVYQMAMLDAIYLSGSTGREVPIARA